MSTSPERIKCLIVGGGPAGYTAAIYASRANLQTVLYEGLQPGGQLTTTTDVENFPGYPQGVSGPEMMMQIREQAGRFGADIRFGSVSKADLSQRPFIITIDETHIIETETLIIATGATARYLGLASEEKYRGQGVSACATCDGFFYKGQEVAVVGGGDTACEEAIYLSNICKKVYMIVRRNVLRASQAMQERVLNNPKIEMLWEDQTKEVLGDSSGVTGALLVNSQGIEKKIDIQGFFLAIGHIPNAELFKPYIATDELGYIRTEPGSTKTNIPGVFAAGDVQDSRYRQAITAAATGCMAAKDAESFLSEQ
ncbi:MAG: thioredoxin-disulfide reductase [Prevotellaceae bacterium]|jgi:thioredoxin reductase (NADPH)|nr:thioredoxin-disulfide reductase [Prevotellaceae bacterium]